MDNETYLRERILSTLSIIENITGVMAHEDKRVMEELKAWQDGKLKSSFFNMLVMCYYDEIVNAG